MRYKRERDNSFTLSVLGVTIFMVRKAAETRPMPMGSTVLRASVATIVEELDTRPNIAKYLLICCLLVGSDQKKNDVWGVLLCLLRKLNVCWR